MPTANAQLPPGPRRSPLRQTIEYAYRPIELFDACEREFGETFTLRLQNMPPLVLVSNPEHVRELFRADPSVLRSGRANAALAAGLGRWSLILLDGEEHIRERRLMLPPFHGERMLVYERLIERAAERRVAELPPGQPLAVADTMRSLTLEVIMRAVFGVDEADRLARVESALVRFIDSTAPPWRLLGLLLAKPGGALVRAWQRFAPTLNGVHAVLTEEIERRRADPRLAERDDILSLLVQVRDEDARPMSDEHLRDELVTLLAAGHETTATALAWTLERLAREPDVLERAHADARAGDGAYLDAVVKEALRIRAILPFVLREAVEPVEIAGVQLPAGVRVGACISLLHRRPDVYPEPDAFRPERFLEDPPSTYEWIPFGGGTRRCIGAAFAQFEMRVVLRTLLRAGTVAAPEPEPEGVGRRGITMVPASGGRIVWSP